MIRVRKEQEDLYIVNREDAAAEGAARHAVLRGFHSQRFYGNHDAEDTLGACGEAAFSLMTGLPMRYASDWNVCKGDDGIDFSFADHNEQVINVDVKAAKKPYYLLLKQSEENNKAHILVLSGVVLFKDEYWTKFYGWDYKANLMRMPLRDFGYGILSHPKHAEQLGKMSTLRGYARNGYEACTG